MKIKFLRIFQYTINFEFHAYIVHDMILLYLITTHNNYCHKVHLGT